MAQLLVVLLLIAASVSETLAQAPGGFRGAGQGSQFGAAGGQFNGQGPLGAGGFPGGFPGGYPGGFPGGLPGGFPGGFPSFPGQGGFFPSFGQNAFQPPLILTCIGTNEAFDTFKMTFRPETSTVLPTQQQQRRELIPQTWRVSAVFLSAASLGQVSPPGTTSLVGQFMLAVTKNGRTDGSCAGLGGILQNEDTISGSNDPFSNNPYVQAMRNQNQAPGHIQDAIFISQSGVYSSVVRNVAAVDLYGRGVGVCMDHNCQRPTTTCCTITRDSAAATEQLGSFTNTGPLSGSALSGATALTGSGGSLGGFSTGRAVGGSGFSSGGNAPTGGLF